MARRAVGAARGLLARAERLAEGDGFEELRSEVRLTREVLGRLVDGEAEQLVALRKLAGAQGRLADELEQLSQRMSHVEERFAEQERRCGEAADWLASVDARVGGLRERLEASLSQVQREVRSASSGLESRAEQQATRLEQTAVGARVALESVTTAMRSLEAELARQIKQSAAALPRAVSEGTMLRMLPALQAASDSAVQRLMPAMEDVGEVTVTQIGLVLGQLQESLIRLEEAAQEGAGVASQLALLDDALRQLRSHTDQQLRRVDEQLGRLSEAVKPLEASEGWRN